MDKMKFKQQVWEAGRAAQSQILSDFEVRLRELEKSENQVREDQFDSQQQSLRGEMDDEISHLGKELVFAQKEQLLLDSLAPGEHPDTEVKLGSVVLTDKMNFFPSVSVEHFKVEDTEFFGISKEAPLYQAMAGKKAGDTFECRGIEYTILDLY